MNAARGGKKSVWVECVGRDFQMRGCICHRFPGERAEKMLTMRGRSCEITRKYHKVQLPPRNLLHEKLCNLET